LRAASAKAKRESDQQEYGKMIMRWTLALTLVLTSTGACKSSSKKVEKDRVETEESIPAGADADADSGSPEPGKEPTSTPMALIDQYPPEFGVFPLSALPSQGRTLTLGFDASGANKFDLIFLYAVAAFPNFDQAATRPNLSTAEAQEAFMTKWAKEFQGRPEYVQRLATLDGQFSLNVDAAFLSKSDVDLSKLLAQAPEFVKLTQTIKGNRFTTKAMGATLITPFMNGQARPLTIPVNVNAYAAAQFTSGKTSYDATCNGCHGNAANPSTYLLHASDSLAFMTDAEIKGVFVNSAYPDATPVSNGQHNYSTQIGIEVDQDAVVAYLRSFPATLDKLEGILVQQTGGAALISPVRPRFY
jgi:hypothetical protein